MKKRRRVTIVDIAKATGVSTATVSYALNGTGRLEASTRQRIIAVSSEMGYRTNFLARNLRNNTSGMIVVSISVPQKTFLMAKEMLSFMSIWQGAMDVALVNGYLLMLAPAGSDPGLFDRTFHDAAVIIDPQTNDELIEYFISRNTRVVTIGEDAAQQSRQEVGVVSNHHGALAREAFELLWEKGARRIALVQGSDTYCYNRDTRRAYQEFVEKKDLPFLLEDVGYVTSEAAGYESMTRLLAQEAAPDAAFVGLDRLACGALLAAQKARLSVPQDLLLVSGTNGTTEYSSVPITSLDLHPAKLGRAAITMLVDCLEGRREMGREILPGKIILRESTENKRTS